jgi:iduronate 2-sulfatase
MRFTVAAAIVLGWVLVAAPAQAEAEPSRPNVLLILSDDLGDNALGTYGNNIVKTPNIDRLAARGVRFDRAYCQFPLCGPSRASLMTGMRPNTCGVLVNGPRIREFHPDVVTMSQVFINNGYFAARTGKIYHLGIPGRVGTEGSDDPASWHHAHNPPGAEFSTPGEEHDPTPKIAQGFRRVLGDGEGVEQADYQAADEAIRLLRENRDRPFFLAVGFIRPHVPVIAPRKYFELYDLEQIQLPHVPEDDRQDIPQQAYHRPQPYWGMDEAECREAIRAYYASTLFMDAQVGRVLDELESLGLTEKTIVVFASDHGYTLGEHQTFQKMMLFEPVARSPLVMAGPGIGKGAAAKGLVELIDIYPTVVELAGHALPDDVDGQSMVALLKDPSQSGREAAYTQLEVADSGREGRSIRTDRWRYTEWNRGEAMELYDHDNDPHEFVNLAEDPDHAQTIEQLRQRLHAVLPPPSQ